MLETIKVIRNRVMVHFSSEEAFEEWLNALSVFVYGYSRPDYQTALLTKGAEPWIGSSNVCFKELLLWDGKGYFSQDVYRKLTGDFALHWGAVSYAMTNSNAFGELKLKANNGETYPVNWPAFLKTYALLQGAIATGQTGNTLCFCYN